MFSRLALKLYSALKQGIIKSNFQFWKNFVSVEKLEKLDVDTRQDKTYLEENNISLIYCFDAEFPIIPTGIKNSEKPFLFAYKGDISLLKKLDNNIAVIGTLNPTEDIKNREERLVQELVKNGFNIVSGLAKGCDSIAHKSCLENNGKTIAILPSTLEKIYPSENKLLVDNIVENGGLVITEYVVEAKNKYESIKRFIDRDRLQAMFSSAVILVASNSYGEGDSGSKHAMNKAKEYSKLRFCMYDEKQDLDNPLFGLNRDEINSGAQIISTSKIKGLRDEISNHHIS